MVVVCFLERKLGGKMCVGDEAKREGERVVFKREKVDDLGCVQRVLWEKGPTLYASLRLEE